MVRDAEKPATAPDKRPAVTHAEYSLFCWLRLNPKVAETWTCWRDAQRSRESVQQEMHACKGNPQAKGALWK